MTIQRTAFELKNRAGNPIRGDVRVPAGAAPKTGPAIVICHGFKGFKDWGFFPYVGEQLVERTGWPTIAFNFSGSGIGPGLENFTDLEGFERNTFTREVEDLGAVLDAAMAGDLPELGEVRRFGLLGHSRGGGIALLRAAEDDRVGCVVTWAAVCTVQRWSEEQRAEWRQKGRLEVLNTRTGQMMPLGLGLLEDIEENADRLDILDAVARLTIPLLLVHGAADESVDPGEAERLAGVAPDESTRLEVIEGTGHTFDAVHPFEGTSGPLERAIEVSAEWFSRHL